MSINSILIKRHLNLYYKIKIDIQNLFGLIMQNEASYNIYLIRLRVLHLININLFVLKF